MITAKKTLAAVMAASLLFSTLIFTGCNKKGNEEKIPEDETWYSVKKVQVGEQFLLEKDVDYSFVWFIGATDNRAVYLIDLHKTIPMWEASNAYDYSDLNQSYLEIYGKDGSLEKTININQKIEDSDMFKLDPDDYPKIVERLRKDEEEKNGSATEKTDKELFKENGISVSWYVEGDYTVSDGFISLTVSAVYPSNNVGKLDSRIIDVVFDASSGEISRHKERKEKDATLTEKKFEFDDYVITYVEKDRTGGEKHYFNIDSSDGRSVTVVSDSFFPGVDDAKIVDSMIYMGGGKILFVRGNPAFGKMMFYEMTLSTGDIIESAKDYSWIQYELDKAKYVDGVGYVICDEEGLKKIDFENKSKVEVFSFNSCNINRSAALNMKLLAMTDECVFLSAFTTKSLQTIFSSSDGETLYILTKEKENPNAGKTVLHATAMSFYSYSICEAVAVFNESNADYYIKLDNDYSVIKKVNSGEISFFDDDYDDKYYKLSSELSYQLAIDLMNGDGPDIVLDGAGIVHLNNRNYLLDLKKEIKTDGLFENMLKASEYDGKLYQVPLGVSLTGIIVSKKDVAEDQYGFTFDQYKELVAGPCNGADPISIYSDRTDYFIRCLNNMKDSYMEKGKVNFDTPAFRAFAEYTKDNVSEKIIPGADALYLTAVENSKRTVRYEVGLTMPTLVSYLPDSITEIKVMGLPSYDGRGPSMTVSSSVGISATTKEKKACMEFVEVLLSEEMQKSFGLYEELTPVRKSAYEATALEAIEKYNSTYKKFKSQYTRDSLFGMRYPFCEVDKKAVSVYEEMLLACSVIDEGDAAITIIVREEMPAYFTGQKSLDDVIKIINDRAQTYVNEREGK